jgi:hypothetical protein
VIGVFGGLRVVVSPLLPMYPTPGEDGRRIVRHGLADVLAWLGEDVGPKPGEPTHAYRIGDVVVCSQEVADRLAFLDRLAFVRARMAGFRGVDFPRLTARIDATRFELRRFPTIRGIDAAFRRDS